ncbi:MAG: exosortase O [Chloroflexota bacterium]
MKLAIPATHLFPLQSKPVRFALNAIILALWCWLFRAVFPYLSTIFTRQEFRTNQVILLGVLALIVIQWRKGDFRPRLDASPQLNLPALGMILGGSIAFLLSERFLEINTLSASMFGLASYGLLGLWMQPQRWRQDMPAALLLIGALPFGEHLETFVGYPLRILTAAIVRDGLSLLGVHSLGIDTILVFESGISQVDIPCSGIKSLWTGSLFLLAATWIERRSINWRWVMAAITFFILLLAANLGRVAVLILVGQVAGWRMAAEMLHVPLGVIGFGSACFAALGLLRWSSPAREVDAPHEQDPPRPQARFSPTLARPAWLAPVLAALILTLAFFYAPRPQTASAQGASSWQFPEELQTESWPLSPREYGWLTSTGASSAQRWTFHWRDLSGSMLFVSSSTWRGHHKPERCFQVYGLEVENSYSHVISPDFTVRLVLLGQDHQRNLLSAAYWLQSAQLRGTDDYAARMWADLSPDRQTWVMVTVLFDGDVDPRATQALDLYQALSQVVQDNLGKK